MKVSDLEQPLSVRVERLLRFVDDLPQLDEDQESDRRAV
jgi:hypothetical protein